MKIGCIVLYKNKPAVVKDSVDDKIVIELEGGDKKVRNKDVVLLCDSPVGSLAEVLNAEITTPDFAEASDFFEEESPTFAELAELLWDDYTPAQMWKMWATIVDSPYFETTSPEAGVKIRTQAEIDEIEKKLAEKNAEEENYNKFGESLNAFLQKKADIDIESYGKFIQEIEALALGNTTKCRAMAVAGIKQTPENAHDVLLKLGYWQIEKNPYPSRFGVSANDSKAEVNEPTFSEGFKDLTSIKSYAIDNEGSTDPDDAVSFDGENLWVHVANPAETVKPDSEGDKIARERGSTLYLPETTARMLGGNAVKYFALGLHNPCFALSFCIRLTDDYEIKNVEIMRTKINVTRLTYEEAEEKKDTPELKPLFDIAEKLLERRLRNGAVVIKMPEAYIYVNRSQQVNQEVVITQNTQLASNSMVREMMLIAGEAGANFAFKHKIPFQFISQDSPTLPNDLPDGLAGEYKKRKAMKSRTVSTTPSKHSALGISMYAQLTSPLRRYGDLVSHQQLLRFIDGEDLIPSDDFLERIAIGEYATRNTIQASRSSRLHWTLVYLEKNKDKIYEAVVLDTNKNSVHIVIPEIAFEYDIKTREQKQLNDIINVKVDEVNIPFQRVVFKEV